MAATPRPLPSAPPAPPADASTLRESMRANALLPEEQAVTRLLHRLPLTGGERHRAVAVAMRLVEGARARRDERPFLDAFLQEFGLSNQEGIALMCIAEALLRIPDDATADRLIAEQLATGNWSSHAGQSESVFVNASTWGLMLTGGMLELDPAIRADSAGWFKKLTRKAGEPLVRLGGAPRDAHHRRRIRGRPQHRGGAGAQRPGGRCRAVFVRHAGRGCAHARRCGAIPAFLRACHRRDRRADGRPRPARDLEHFDQAVGARAALFAAATRRACSSGWCRACSDSRGGRRRRHAAHDRRRGGRPPRSVARHHRRAWRPMRPRATGRAWASRCRPTASGRWT